MQIRVHVRAKPDRKTLQLYYVDPLTGNDVTRSAKTDDWKEAERRAALWQAEIEAGKVPHRISWDAFRERFDDEYLDGREPNTVTAYGRVLNQFETLIGHPRQLSGVDASTISIFAKKMKEAGLANSTVCGYLRHLKAALRWAAKLGLINQAPAFVMPKSHGADKAKGRPIRADEFAKMIEKAPQVVGEPHAAGWRFLLEGIWLSGLRINEAMRLSWDAPPVHLMLDARPYPVIAWRKGDGQKSRKRELSPLTPDFFAFLSAVPEKNRRGPVFKVTHATRKVDQWVASATITAIGEAAGVIVNDEGKHGSAHDLRRSFGTRWALKVPPIALQRMMRHKSLQTTLEYYLDLEIADLGAAIWGENVPPAVPQQPSDENRTARKTA